LRADRLVELGAEATLFDAAVQQGRPEVRRQPAGAVQRAGVLRGGLAVRARRRGSLGRPGGPLEHTARVIRGVGMVREPREVGVVATARGQGLDRGAMEGEAAVRGDRVLDREPGQLVAERDVRPPRDQHPRREALVNAILDRTGHPRKQPRLDLTRHDRDRLE
jgi:hypothetical protein